MIKCRGPETLYFANADAAKRNATEIRRSRVLTNFVVHFARGDAAGRLEMLQSQLLLNHLSDSPYKQQG